ncbi:MAG: hypothetical protein H6737_02105 [Alphaproteobacteria bacterium]|nr:hypothetical protein [Alphaproteobacteria bacterium]
MKLPESLVVAVGCAALAGCQTSWAGGRKAIPEVQVTETKPAPIAEVGPQTGEAPVKSVKAAVLIPEATQPVKPAQPEPVIEVDWSEWDCPACGMG